MSFMACLIRRRRSRLEIIANILSVSERGASKTSIIRRANLNFERANRYIDFLLSRGLLFKSTESETIEYVVTESGRAFLRDYKEIKRLERDLYKRLKRLKRRLEPKEGKDTLL